MKWRLFLVLGAALLALDQFTKAAVHGMYLNGSLGQGRSVRIVGDLLRLSYEQNLHGVFGLVYGPRFLYILLPLVGTVLIIWLGVRSSRVWLAVAYAFILGGALGNAMDRIRFGYVIDFIIFELRRFNFRWFTFNLADAWLLIGIIMIIVSELFQRPRPAPSSDGPDSAP